MVTTKLVPGHHDSAWATSPGAGRASAATERSAATDVTSSDSTSSAARVWPRLAVRPDLGGAGGVTHGAGQGGQRRGVQGDPRVGHDQAGALQRTPRGGGAGGLDHQQQPGAALRGPRQQGHQRVLAGLLQRRHRVHVGGHRVLLHWRVWAGSGPARAGRSPRGRGQA